MTGLLRSKRGATSVMLLLLLLVLIIFGVLAFMSAYANYRLGQSGQTWYQASYQLDSQGESLVAQVDDVLAQAESTARDAVAGTVQPEDTAVLPLLASYDSEKFSSQAVWAAQVYDRLYLYFAAQGLSQLGLDATQSTPSFVFVYGGEAQSPEEFLDLDLPLSDPALTLSGTLTSLDERRILSIDCAITAPAYDFALAGGKLTGLRQANAARYRITRWQQSQPALEPTDVFNGTVD